jgi:hypothetical protein
MLFIGVNQIGVPLGSYFLEVRTMSIATEALLQKSGRSQRKQDAKCKILPTERISFGKHFDLLRAYAVASGANNKPVSNNDVAPLVKMTPATVSLSNSFFADVGFLQRSNGGYIPAPEVLSFNHAFGWNPDSAAHKLAPLLEKSWFAQAILNKANFGELTEDEAIQDLSEAAGASPEKRSQLQILLAYLSAAGLIVQENGRVRAPTRIERQSSISANGSGQREPQSDVKDEGEVMIHRSSTVATSFAVPTEGTVRFNVSVCVDMAEFKGWEASRIGAFFAGIAQVLAAKAAVEKTSSPA